jgi:Bacterial regulatory proteins, gntR family
MERGGRPKYWLIATALREAIDSGEYPPGARLPGENDLMRDRAVARATARQALAQLVNWGLAEARKGSGIYVRDFRPVVRDGIARLGAYTWPSGVSVWEIETEGRDLVVDQVDVVEEDAPPGASVGCLTCPTARPRWSAAVGTSLTTSRFCCPGLGCQRQSLPAPRSPNSIQGLAASTLASPKPATPRRGSVRTCAPGCRAQRRPSAWRSRQERRSWTSAASPLTPTKPRLRSTR